MKKKFLLSLLLLCLLSQTAWSLSVDKLNIFCRSSGLYGIKVRNDSGGMESYIVSKMVWYRDESAVNIWKKFGGEEHKDSSDWIELKTTEFSLGASERREIFFSITIPKKLKTQHWSAIVITTKTAGKGFGLAMRFRIKVFAQPAKPFENGKITGMKYEDGKLIFSFQNTGSIQLKCEWVVGDLKGTFFILPRYEHIIVKEVEAEGEKIELVIDYGSGRKGGRLWLQKLS